MPAISSGHHELRVVFRQRGYASTDDILFHAGYLFTVQVPKFLNFSYAKYLST